MQIRKLLAALCAVAVVTGAASIASGAPGDLDPGFNGSGKRVIDFGGTDTVSAMAVQPDGKIVLVGNGPGETFTITRLNPDGSVDTGFGGSGTGTFRFNFGHPGIPRAVTLAPDGKIYVAGQVRVSDDNHDAAVARLNADGTPDTTFASEGWRDADFGGDDDVATGVATLPDGKIILAGQGTPNRRFVIARLTPKIYDPTFAGGGITTVALGSGADAFALAIAPDGKIVVAGTAYVPGTGADFGVARLNADGTPDDSFDGDGQKTIDFGGTTDEAHGVAVTPDGKILIAGHSNISNFALVRLGSTGAPDLSFNGDGTLRVAFGLPNTYAEAVAVQPDGKIALVGKAGNAFGFARVLPSGALDTSFGDTGRQVVPFDSTPYDQANAIGLEPDGGIVAGGNRGGPSNRDLAVVKLQGDGTGSSPGGPGGSGGPGGGGSGASLKCGGKRATVVGTNGRDRLKGGRRADVIVGLGGNDTISGLGGNDVICGGNGNDKLSGGAGKDKVFGQAGKDSLTGGSGNDSLSGGAGKDKLSGGAGKDRLLGGPGKDRCAGHDRKSSC